MPGLAPGPLPGPGGVGDQGAWLSDAIEIAQAAWREIEKREGGSAP